MHRKLTRQFRQVRIDNITIVHYIDESPDTSTLGEYTNDCEPGNIIRQCGEYYERIKTEMERDYDGRFSGKLPPEINRYSREMLAFKPYAGGEKVGTKAYYKYGMQDYERMESLNNGNYCYIGIMAKAEVSYHIGQGHRRIEHFTSGGLWGIESDSDKSYIQEIESEEIADLKRHLSTFGIRYRYSGEIEYKEVG